MLLPLVVGHISMDIVTLVVHSDTLYRAIQLAAL